MVGKKEASNPKYSNTDLEISLFLKSQKIPSDNAETVVVISPVSFIAIKSPGNIIL